jgi:hypothetical protein
LVLIWGRDQRRGLRQIGTTGKISGLMRLVMALAAEAVVMRGLDPHIHLFKKSLQESDGLPGQVFSPGTWPTPVRGHDRHLDPWHGFGLPNRQIHAL